MVLGCNLTFEDEEVLRFVVSKEHVLLLTNLHLHLAFEPLDY